MGNVATLDARMKGYEFVSRHYLTRRTPVIIRIDGKAFHSYCKGMKKPFDWVFTQSMIRTMKYLCQNIQGCVLAYRQSDEISLLLIDYHTIKTDAWFDNNLQKIVSISASMATAAFNNALRDILEENEWIHKDEKYYDSMKKKVGNALFDSRAFVLPKEEVCNYFIWRQQDATRNSILDLGYHYFSKNSLHGKKTNDIQDMLFKMHGVNWNDLSTMYKRGLCTYKVQYIGKGIDPRKPDEVIDVIRNQIFVDTEIPIFTQDREFIERWLNPNFTLLQDIPKDFTDKSGVKIVDTE